METRELSYGSGRVTRLGGALVSARSAGVLPGHYDRMEPGLHARRLARLVARTAE